MIKACHLSFHVFLITACYQVQYMECADRKHFYTLWGMKTKGNGSEYTLPKLYFEKDDLEPYIDAATVEAHYNGHHAAYTKKMNIALENWRNELPSDQLAHSTIIKILQNLEKVPKPYYKSIRNNGGGYLNHCFYWGTMTPNPEKTERKPDVTFLERINTFFESFENFKSKFEEEALALFGSGYVWLVRKPDESLEIVMSVNQDSPLSQGDFPILVLDVWEHAYYLKHQFRRAKHVEDWWMITDWDKVEQLDNMWKDMNSPESKDEL